MNEPVKALIAVKSAELRDALHALLESIELVGAIYQAADAQASKAIVTTHRPALALADSDLARAIGAQPDMVLLVLVDDRAEQERARAAGASRVFVKGTPVSQLVTAIESLLRGGDGRSR